MKAQNLHTGLPCTLPDEVFERLVDRPQITIERILSKGHASPPGHWFDQGRDEWVLLLQGQAVLEFENQPQTMNLRAGDYLLIPAHCRHRVAWNDPDHVTLWLAVHF